MDFVISKVAMSICALMVVSILGGVFDPGRFIDTSSELERILDELREAATMTSMSGAGSSVCWIIPCLASGESVGVSIDADVAKCASHKDLKAMNIGLILRTWTWDGSAMNVSRVNLLDDSADPLRGHSGEGFVFSCVDILIDNEPTAIVFVAVRS